MPLPKIFGLSRGWPMAPGQGHTPNKGGGYATALRSPVSGLVMLSPVTGLPMTSPVSA